MSNLPLSPFPYHVRLKDHFKGREKTWNWFREKKNRDKQVKKFKSELLKNTYRLEPSAHPKLYELVDIVCTKLNLDAEVTLYQENYSLQMNAGISIIDKEAHIVLSGNILTVLNEDELTALLAHELSHYLFYKTDEEAFETTNRIILSLANDEAGSNPTIETARVFRLYMELFCDAGALKVCDDYKIVIQMLVKINTGINDIHADSYLAQAKEIIKEDKKGTLQDSHPESYIRSIAIHLRSTNSDDYFEDLKPLIEGRLNIDKLDIFEQKELEVLTHDMIKFILKPSWMNSETVKNLYQQYFDKSLKSYSDQDRTVNEVEKIIKEVDDNVQKYLSYVLLDFAKVDNHLEGAPMAHTLELSELLGLKTPYAKVVRKELNLSMRDFKKMRMRFAKELMELTENIKDSLYDE